MWSHLTFIFFSLHLCVSQKLQLAPIYWNTSNPLFKSSTSTNPIEVEMYYEIDLVCPTYPPDHPTHLQETYIIYQVPKADHSDCELRNDISMLVNCSAPHERRRFTLIFQAFQPIANTPDYREGETYYAITTSTGRKDGLKNTHLGACASNHMKVAFYIRPSGLTKVKPNHPNNLITTRRPRKKATTTQLPHTTRLLITSHPLSGNNRQFDPNYPYYTVNNKNNKNSISYNTTYNHNHSKYNNKNTNFRNNNQITNDDSFYNKNKNTKNKNNNKNNLYNKGRSAPGFATSSNTISYPQRQQPNKNNKTKYFKTNPNNNKNSFNNNISNNNNNINNKNNKNNAPILSTSVFPSILYVHSLILATKLLRLFPIYL